MSRRNAFIRGGDRWSYSRSARITNLLVNITKVIGNPVTCAFAVISRFAGLSLRGNLAGLR